MKSTQATVRQRVDEVYRIRLLGAEFPDIRQHASEQGWGVSDRQLWRYVAQGDRLLAETREKDRDKLLNRHVAQRRVVYARAMSVSDFRTALAALKDEGQLLGLYPARKHELTGQGGGPVQLDARHEYEHLRHLPADELLRLYRQEVDAPAPPAGQPPPPGP